VAAGIGIPHDMQEKIFEAFSQADMSTTKRYGGTGLGLTVSLQLVRQMGGQLTVTSEPGRGSSFSFTLTFPVVDPEAAGTQFSSSASEDESTLNTQSSPPMIAAASLALREIVTMPLESGTLEDQHDVKYSLQTPRTLPCIPSSAGSDPAGTDAAVIFHSEIPAQMVDSQLTSETVSSLYDTISRRYSVSSSSLGSCMAGMSLSAMPRGVSDSHRQTTVSTPSSRAAESDGPMLHWKESTPQSQQRVLMLRGGRLPEADPAISTGLRTQSCPLSFAPSWTGRTVDSPLLLPPAAAPFAITPAIEPLSPTALSSAAVDSLSCSATVDSHPATTSTSQQPSERICLLPPVEPFAPVLDRSRVTGSLLALRPKPIDICFVSAEAEPTLFDVPPQSSLLLHRESPAHPPSMRIDVQLAGAERSSRLATRYSHVSATLNAHRPCLHIASGAVIPPPTVEPNPEEHPLMLPRAQSLPKLTPASMIVKAAPSPMCPPAALLSASPLPSPPTAESPSTLALMCPEHCSEQARLHRIEHARSLHILCAEDNLTNQKVLRKILTREGHTIVMADNGQIAVSIFEQSAAQFDCVLLDMCMPVMDGIEACKHMRALESRWKNDAPTGPSLPDAAPTPSLLPPAAHHPTRAVTEPSLVRLARIPIIAVTASSLLEDKVTCVEAGMDDVICKPLSPKALARVLRSIVSLFHPAPTSAGSSSRRLQERPSTPATSTFTSAVHPLGSPSVDICHA
jgi:CheY-like chemotaxis protein